MNYKSFFCDLLNKLDIDEPLFLILKEKDFFERFENINDISLFFGESYMDKEWESSDLAGLFKKIMNADLKNYNELFLVNLYKKPIETISLISNIIESEIKINLNDLFNNNQTVSLSKEVGLIHYDTPDILYDYMLDKNRQYTCGYWKPNTYTLEDAQTNKIQLLIKKLQIKDNTPMNILDIGCGWGGLTNAISERYPLVKITGISISAEQIKNANKRYCKNPNLKYLFLDYRDLPKQNITYDRIVSVGMFEHVGIKNYNKFFKIINTIMTCDGIFVLHLITKPIQEKFIFGNEKFSGDAWISKYIFPGGYIPIAESILTSAQTNNLMCHHMQNLSISYGKTLKEWYINFKKNWSKIQISDPVYFTEKFYRMWEFYLLCSMVNFETKKLQLMQYVITKNEFPDMYVLNEED